MGRGWGLLRPLFRLIEMIAASPTTRAGLATAFLAMIFLLASSQPSYAGLACPVMLYAGKVSQGTVTLSFRNQGKVPIREIDLACTPLHGRKSDCHTEPGVFFPGTPYDINFSYPGKSPRSMVLSVKAAIYAGGLRWTSLRDQPCKSLRITNR
jgi:hypothetical protein